MVEYFNENGLPVDIDEIPLTPSAKASLNRIHELAHQGTGWYRLHDGEHEVTVHYVAKDGTGYTTTIVWD